MRRLILLRHAKSSWAEADQRDIDRPLNDRGRRDAPRMGAWLRGNGYLPDLALVSVAERTRQTWEGVASTLGQGPVEFVEALYHASAERMLAVLRGAQGGTVLMLGHQPGIGQTAARLLSNPPGDEDFRTYPTAATAVLDFDIEDWDEVHWGMARLTDFAVPRKLA